MGMWQWLIIIFVVLVWAIGVIILWLGVPPLPSRRQKINQFFTLARILPNERVFDLGAGDGRVLQISRDRYQAKISGWELHPLLWLLAKWRLGGTADIRLANLWRAPIEEADVVFVFLMPRLMLRVQKLIWPRLRPGARLISNSFPLPDEDPQEIADGVYLYIKPS